MESQLPPATPMQRGGSLGSHQTPAPFPPPPPINSPYDDDEEMVEQPTPQTPAPLTELDLDEQEAQNAILEDIRQNVRVPRQPVPREQAGGSSLTYL